MLLPALLLTFYGALQASDARSHVREGNSHFEEGRYVDAEVAYRRALEADEANFTALFNLGNALYKQGRLEEAAELFDALSHMAPGDRERANAFHNLGNSRLGAGQVAESIDAYKGALRIEPGDEDTRYNLAYAMQLLDDMPPQQQEHEPSPDGDNGDDQEPDDGQSPEDQAGDDDQEMDGDQPAGDQQDGARGQSEQLSHEEAMSLLDALRQQEQEVQEKINRDDQRSEPHATEREW